MVTTPTCDTRARIVADMYINWKLVKGSQSEKELKYTLFVIRSVTADLVSIRMLEYMWRDLHLRINPNRNEYEPKDYEPLGAIVDDPKKRAKFMEDYKDVMP